MLWLVALAWFLMSIVCALVVGPCISAAGGRGPSVRENEAASKQVPDNVDDELQLVP